MELWLNGSLVDCELEKNADGSKFVVKGYYVSSDLDLIDSELDQVQQQNDDVINANWKGE